MLMILRLFWKRAKFPLVPKQTKYVLISEFPFSFFVDKLSDKKQFSHTIPTLKHTSSLVDPGRRRRFRWGGRLPSGPRNRGHRHLERHPQGHLDLGGGSGGPPTPGPCLERVVVCSGRFHRPGFGVRARKFH